MAVLEDSYVRSATLLRVIDGDTLRVDLDLGWTHRMTEDVRLVGVDTPEPRGGESPAGKFVTRQLIDWLGETTQLFVHSHQFSLGKFGRTLATVWANGQSINGWLLDSQLGWPTDDHGNIVGRRSLDRLQLPAGIRQACIENLS